MNKSLIAFAFACLTSMAFAGPHFKMMTAPELATAMHQKDHAPMVFDVNNEETRHKDGIIPGAKLLPSSSSYDVTKELPADKGAMLVFYCANTKCTASHKAAEHAMTAGYKEVAVMSDGIQGWAKSGQPVNKAAK